MKKLMLPDSNWVRIPILSGTNSCLRHDGTEGNEASHGPRRGSR